MNLRSKRCKKPSLPLRRAVSGPPKTNTENSPPLPFRNCPQRAHLKSHLISPNSSNRPYPLPNCRQKTGRQLRLESRKNKYNRPKTLNISEQSNGSAPGSPAMCPIGQMLHQFPTAVLSQANLWFFAFGAFWGILYMELNKHSEQISRLSRHVAELSMR